MGVEFLEFDLGFEAVLGFHNYVYQFVVVVLPFFDAPEVAGSALVVDDKGHNVMTQAFLEHKQSANPSVAVLKGEYLLEADMEVQNVVTLDLGLFFVGSDQFCQTGMDLVRVQELTVSGTGCDGAVLARTHLFFVLVHGAGHQEMMELADELLGQGFHHMIQDVIHAMNVIQHLDHVGDFQGFKGLPDLALFEDGLHLLAG